MKVMYPFEETFLDYPDNKSNAILVYFIGCSFSCEGCHNKDLQDENYINGFEMDAETLIKSIQYSCEKSKTNKIVFEGGDPLYKGNFLNVFKAVEKLKNNYDITIYTGNDIETIKALREKLSFKGYKFIKCGKYIQRLKQKSEKTDEYISFGSKNQELYDGNLNLLSKDGIYYFGGKNK